MSRSERTSRGEDPRRGLARRGEALAESVLRDAGLSLVERNFRCRLGEIDLVARDGDTIVFVEVKTRSGCRAGAPAESVTARKRARLGRVALAFLARRPAPHPPTRFDVVEVDVRGAGEARVRHIRDAFRLWPGG